MRAGQLVGPRRLQVIDVRRPPVPREHEVGIRLISMGICGSDLSLGYRREFRTYPGPPGFPGHECLGQVEQSHSTTVDVGERVLVHPPRLRGLQEFLVVSASRIARVPPEGDGTLWLLCEPLATVLHALERLPRLIGKSVTIVGQGTMGLIWTHVASKLGAARIHAFDPEEERLALASEAGATHTSQIDNADHLDKGLAVGGRTDVAVDAAGNELAIGLASMMAKPGGTLVLFGVPQTDDIVIHHQLLQTKELTVVFTAPGRGDQISRIMARAVAAVQGGWIDLSWIPRSVFALSQVQTAFDHADRRVGVKTLIDMKI